MATTRRNFSGQLTPSVDDDEFDWCNFSQRTTRIVDGKRRGIVLEWLTVRRRRFTNCNMCNVEPAPGDILINCLTVIKEFDVDDGEGGKKHVIYGRINQDTLEYEYKDVPEDYMKRSKP